VSLSFSDQTSNVAAQFFRMASQAPDQLALITEAEVFNYEDLAEFVREFAGAMRTRGVGPGSIVCIDTDDFLIATPALLATSMAGAAWMVPATHAVSSDLITPSHFFSSRPATLSSDPRYQHIARDWGLQKAHPDAVQTNFPGYTDPEAPWMFSRTSGTTGNPKIITFSQRISFDRSMAVKDDFVYRKTVFTSLFDCNARPYITRVLAALLNGCTIVSSQKTKLWEMVGVNLIYGSTAQLQRAFAETVLPKKIPVVHVTGSKHTEKLTRQLLRSFDQVIDLYAASETNRSFKNIQTLDSEGNMVTVGKPVDSKVEIVDDDGNLCKNNELGTVRVQSPYMINGYFNAAEATVRAFRDGWFYPGDFGYWGPRGQLVVLGRLGDVINSGGIKVNAAEIDEVLQDLEGVEDAMSFEYSSEQEGGSEIIAFVKPAPGADILAISLAAQEACLSKLGAVRTPARFVEVEGVPRAHDGGAQRFLCESIYQGLKAV
jgi:acyl-coenzyme A synthetase/AMP-(fatty) acid ligase